GPVCGERPGTAIHVSVSRFDRALQVKRKNKLHVEHAGNESLAVIYGDLTRNSTDLWILKGSRDGQQRIGRNDAIGIESDHNCSTGCRKRHVKRSSIPAA